MTQAKHNAALRPDARRALQRAAVAGILGLGLCLASRPSAAFVPAPDFAARTPDAFQVELLALTLNGVPRDDVFFLVGPQGAVYASQAMLDEYGLRVDGDERRTSDGETFRPLSAVAGASWHIMQSESRLVLDVPALSIKTVSDINIVSHEPAPPPSRNAGAFLNYDLLSFGENPGDDYSAAFETGLFGPWGVLSNDFVYRDTLFGDDLLRLQSAVQYDDPDTATTLRLGDAISRPDVIGNAVRFAGVQYGTNFATQPYFLTFPQPTLQGRTSLPSTVDVYIDNVLRGSQNVPAGGFSTQALPITTGRGTVRLQVRDALGRETVITQPFFITSDLLKPGLTDFSLSAGVLRENYAIQSNDYGQALVNGLWRHGLTDRVTASVFSASQPRVQTSGTSATVKLGESAVAQAGAAGSHSRQGAGIKGRLAFDQQLGLVSYGAAIEQASPRYRPIGARDQFFFEPRQTLTANLGVSLGAVGNLTANYLRRDYRDQGTITIVNLSFTRSIGPGFLSLGVFRTQAVGDRGYAGQVLFTLPLGTQTSASAGAATDNAGSSEFAEVQRSLPVGPGYGYRLRGATGDASDSLAEVAARSDYGTYRVGAARFNGRTSYQAEASGGVAVIGGGVFASRRIDDSFALVEIPGFDNVRVYDQNRLIGRTDARGRVLVPQLLPYQTNKIRLEPGDLPLNASIPGLERDAVPYFRSGTVTRFAVERTNSATFVVHAPSGTPLEPGVELVSQNTGIRFPIGYDGYAYASGLEPGINYFHAKWSGGVCNVSLTYPAKAEIQPDLGTVICQPVAP